MMAQVPSMDDIHFTFRLGLLQNFNVPLTIFVGFLWEITHGGSETPHIDFAEGIPEEAFDLECSDDELKVTVLQEFIILDEKFRERLHFLEDEHSKILR